MRSPKYKGERVYVVVWPEQLIVKAGYTAETRWRQFTKRGAVLHQLTRLRDYRAAFDYEAQVLGYLQTVGRYAFASAHEAVPFLGGRGGGYCEAFAVPALDILRALPQAATEQCLAGPERSGFTATPLLRALHVLDEQTNELTQNHSAQVNLSPNASSAKSASCDHRRAAS